MHILRYVYLHFVFQALSTALEYYDDLTGSHVIQSLDKYFSMDLLASDPLPHKRRIFQLYDEKKDDLYNATELEVILAIDENYLPL